MEKWRLSNTPTIRRLTPSSRHQLSRIALGALIAHWEIDHWAVDAVGAPHVGDRTEKELITAFCDKIAELSPQLTLAYNPATKIAPSKR